MFTEEKLSSNKVFSGKLIDVLHDDVLLSNGKKAFREIVTHPGAVAIVAVYCGKVVFVRQYRYAVSELLLEIPAGKLEKGEDLRRAAERELREETGLQSRHTVYMGPVYSSPGLLGEVLHLYFADDLCYVGENPDEDELLQACAFTVPEVFSMIRNGEIKDAKTLSGLMLARAKGLLKEEL